MKIFNWNNSEGEIELNIPEIGLIPEFREMLNVDRNKTKEDPEGLYKKVAFREFTYIYLMWDWTSPFYDLGEAIRQEEALSCIEMTRDEYNENVLLKQAEFRFKTIQESFSSYRLFSAAKEMVENLYEYFKFIVDLSATKEDGTPTYKAKDVIAEIGSIGKVFETLKDAERRYKSDLDEDSKARGESTPGFFDTYRK